MKHEKARLTPAPSAAYLAWESIRRTMAEFAKQERQALKRHAPIAHIYKARKAYMTSILRGKGTAQ